MGPSRSATSAPCRLHAIAATHRTPSGVCRRTDVSSLRWPAGEWGLMPSDPRGATAREVGVARRRSLAWDRGRPRRLRRHGSRVASTASLRDGASRTANCVAAPERPLCAAVVHRHEARPGPPRHSAQSRDRAGPAAHTCCRRLGTRSRPRALHARVARGRVTPPRSTGPYRQWRKVGRCRASPYGWPLTEVRSAVAALVHWSVILESDRTEAKP